jgi:Saxitoxin biosynthesis operon protein SxtJ
MIELDLRPDTSKLRQFGGVAFVALGLLAAWSYWKSSLFGVELGAARLRWVGTLSALGVFSGLMSLIAPRANRPLYLALAVAGFPIGYVLSHAAVATIFYLILTPLGLVFRLLGRDPLERRFEPEAETYWVARTKKRDKERYFSQF